MSFPSIHLVTTYPGQVCGGAWFLSQAAQGIRLVSLSNFTTVKQITIPCRQIHHQFFECALQNKKLSVSKQIKLIYCHF